MKINCNNKIIKPLKFNLLQNLNMKRSKLYYKNKQIDYERFYVSRGGFGAAYKLIFKINNKVYSVIEKISVYGELTEIKILKKLTKVDCSFIPYKLTSSKTLLMFEATGTLEDFRDKLTHKKRIEIIRELKKIIDCFRAKNLNYLDFKLDNILYICDNDTVKIYLGDLGSFAKNEYNTYDTLYIPDDMILSKYSKFFTDDVDDKTYSFYMGLIYLQLLDPKDIILKINKTSIEYNVLDLFVGSRNFYIDEDIKKYGSIITKLNLTKNRNKIINKLRKELDKYKKKYKILNTLNNYDERELITKYL